MMRYVLLFFGLGLISSTGFTQTRRISLGSLKIGDTIPAGLSFTVVKNYPFLQIPLSNLKGRAVILDIWGTYCGSCIAELPKLDSVQRQFKEKLVILSVSQQDTKTVAQFAEDNENARDVSFPIAAGDSMLPKYFRFKTIPCQIWLDEYGVIKAITNAGYVNQQNVQKLIEGKDLSLPLKEDFMEFDQYAPLMNNLTAGEKSVISQSLFTRYQPGINTRIINNLDTASNLRRITCYNMPVALLYRVALPGLQLNHVILENVNEQFFYSRRVSSITPTENLYCLECTLSADRKPSEFSKTMHYDLDYYLGFKSRFEERTVKVYVLDRLKNGELDLASKGGKSSDNLYKSQDSIKYIHNEPLDVLVYFLNMRVTESSGAPIFLNESNLKSNVDMDLPITDYNDIGSMKTALNRYGLDLHLDERKIKMFVVSKAE